MIDRNINFSLWLDFIERDYLKKGFKQLLDKGIINGATSNPSIFASAINNSVAYKRQLESLKGRTGKEKYEILAIEDIKTAGKLLRPLYENRNDGFISIEVDPFLSNDTEGTYREGERLFKLIDEPNIMIKIPATDEGYSAMTKLMEQGISINATLVFSQEQTIKCLEAMERGIKKFQDKNSGSINGVISVFVSRFDRTLDDKLLSAGIQPSRTGVLNATKIYKTVESRGISNIRTLFASTGVKGDNLPPDYYIKELMFPNSINTAPLATIESHLNNPTKTTNIPVDDKIIKEYFENLKNVGFDIDEIANRLLKEGLESFEKAFEEMLESLKN